MDSINLKHLQLEYTLKAITIRDSVKGIIFTYNIFDDCLDNFPAQFANQIDEVKSYIKSNLLQTDIGMYLAKEILNNRIASMIESINDELDIYYITVKIVILVYKNLNLKSNEIKDILMTNYSKEYNRVLYYISCGK